MNRIVSVTYATLLLALLIPATSGAQMGALEQSLGRLQNRLDTRVFDGKTLKVTTWPELRKVEDFLKRYGKNLQKAIKAWKALKAGKTQARLNKLKAAQGYFKALYSRYLAKRKQIHPPKKQQKVKVVDASFDAVVTGPGAKLDKPALIDLYGDQETQLQAWGSPGTRSKPSMWSVRMKFAVKYKGFTSSDVVMAQVYKGARKLKAPIPCKPMLITGWPVALFQCSSPHRDRSKMFNSAGVHTIKLSYKNLVLGKTFKNFATLRLDVLKLWAGSVTRPSVSWRTNHDIHRPPTTIEERNPTGTSGHRDRFVQTFQNSALSAMKGSGVRFLELRTWVKYDKYFTTEATCLYKGKPAWAAVRNNGRLGWDVHGRIKKGSKKEFKARWQEMRFQLQGLKIVGQDGGRGSWSKEPHWLDKNPGEYKCVITGDGKVLKEVFFTVGEGGHLVKPACQDKILTTFKTITLVKAKDKKWGELKWSKGKSAFSGNVPWKRSCP